MEKFSENPARRKRGRPSVFSTQEISLAQMSVGEPRTSRHLANVAYRTRAMAVLMDDKRFRWLFDSDKSNAHERKAWQPTILAELGRISKDPEVIRAFAIRLCMVKPPVCEAVAMLRNIRLNKRGAKRRPPKPLAGRILAVVRDYRRRYPDMTDREALDALQDATAAFEAALTDDDEATP